MESGKNPKAIPAPSSKVITRLGATELLKKSGSFSSARFALAQAGIKSKTASHRDIRKGFLGRLVILYAHRNRVTTFACRLALALPVLPFEREIAVKAWRPRYAANVLGFKSSGINSPFSIR